MNYSHLNHHIPPVSEGVSDAWLRAMGRLGDYTALVMYQAEGREFEDLQADFDAVMASLEYIAEDDPSEGEGHCDHHHG